MVNSNKIVINKAVHIIQDKGHLVISKSYAESRLSKSALKYAEKTSNNYVFSWGRTSYIVAFELPRLFNIQFVEIMRFLVSYNLPYVTENRLTDSVMYPQFVENMNKAV